MSQHMEALNKANNFRTAGAKFRREVNTLGYAEGCGLLAAYLERNNLPPEIAAMRVDRYLSCVRRIGAHKVEALYRIAGLHRRTSKSASDPVFRVRDLTERERMALAQALRVSEPQERAA